MKKIRQVEEQMNKVYLQFINEKDEEKKQEYMEELKGLVREFSDFYSKGSK